MAQVPALTIAVLFCVAIVSGAAAPPDFADQSGQRFLYMAFAAYQHNGTYDSLLNWSCPCCTALNTFWPATRMSDTQWFQYLPRDLFAYVGYEHSLRSVVLSFRGSQDLENWIVNLQFAKTVPYGDNKGKVHSGFYHGYLDMKPMLLPYIRALMQRFGSANILCTGHSLGGAMAQLAAVDLSETLGPSANVSSVRRHLQAHHVRIASDVSLQVTYGTPRTGDAQWASYFASTLRGVYVSARCPAHPSLTVLHRTATGALCTGSTLCRICRRWVSISITRRARPGMTPT